MSTTHADDDGLVAVVDEMRRFIPGAGSHLARGLIIRHRIPVVKIGRAKFARRAVLEPILKDLVRQASG